MALRMSRTIDIPQNSRPIVERGQIIKQENVISRQQSQVSYTRSVSTSSKTVKMINGEVVDEEFSPAQTIVETRETNSSQHNEQYKHSNITYGKPSPYFVTSQHAFKGTSSAQIISADLTNPNLEIGNNKAIASGHNVTFSQTQGSEQISRKTITKSQLITSGQSIDTPKDKQNQISFSESPQVNGVRPQKEHQPTEIGRNSYKIYKIGRNMPFPRRNEEKRLVSMRDPDHPDRGVDTLRGTYNTSSGPSVSYNETSKGYFTLLAGQDPQNPRQSFSNDKQIDKTTTMKNNHAYSTTSVSKTMHQESICKKMVITRENTTGVQPSIDIGTLTPANANVNENDQSAGTTVSYEHGKYVNTAKPLNEKGNTSLHSIDREDSLKTQKTYNSPSTIVDITRQNSYSQSNSIVTSQTASTTLSTNQQIHQSRDRNNKTTYQIYSTRNGRTYKQENKQNLPTQTTNENKNNKDDISQITSSTNTVETVPTQKRYIKDIQSTNWDDTRQQKQTKIIQKQQNVSQKKPPEGFTQKIENNERYQRMEMVQFTSHLKKNDSPRAEMKKGIEKETYIEITDPQSTTLSISGKKEIKKDNKKQPTQKQKPNDIHDLIDTKNGKTSNKQLVNVKTLHHTQNKSQHKPDAPKEKRETPRVKKLNIPDFTTKEVTKTEVTDVKKLDRTLYERTTTEEEDQPERPKDKPKRLVIPEFTSKEVVRQEEVVPVQRLNTTLFESPEEPDGPQPKREAPKVNKLQMPDFTTKEVTKTEVTEVRRLDRSFLEHKEPEEPEPVKREPVRQRKLRNDFITTFQNEEPQESQPEKQKESPKKLKIPEFTTRDVVKQEEVVQVQRLDRTLFESRHEPEEPTEKRETPRVKKLNIPDFTTKEVTKTEVTDVKKLDRTLYERTTTEEEDQPERPKDKPKRLVIPEFTSKEVVRQEEVVPVQRLNTTLFESPEEPDGPQPKREAPKVNKLQMPDFTTKEVTKTEVTELRRFGRGLVVRKEPEEPKSGYREISRQGTGHKVALRSCFLDKSERGISNNYQERPETFLTSQFDSSEFARHDDLNIGKGREIDFQGKGVQVSLSFKQREIREPSVQEKDGNFVAIEERKTSVKHQFSPKFERGKAMKESEREVFDAGKQRFTPVDTARTAFVDVSVLRQGIKSIQTKDEFSSVNDPQNVISKERRDGNVKFEVRRSQKPGKTTELEKRTSDDVRVVVNQNSSHQNDNAESSRWTTQTSLQTSKITAPYIKEESKGPRKVDLTVRQINTPHQRSQHSYQWEIRSSEKTVDADRKEKVPRHVDVSVRQVDYPYQQKNESRTTFTTKQSGQMRSSKVDDYTFSKSEVPQKQMHSGYKWSDQSSNKTTKTAISTIDKEESRQSNVDIRVRRVDIPRELSGQSNQSGSSGTEKNRILSVSQSNEIIIPTGEQTNDRSQQKRGYKWSIQSSKQARSASGDITVRNDNFPEQNRQQTYRWGFQSSRQTSIFPSQQEAKGPRDIDIAVRKIDILRQNSQQTPVWSTQTNRQTSAPSTEKDTRGSQNNDFNVRNGKLSQQQEQQNYKRGIQHSQQTSLYKPYQTTQSKETRVDDIGVQFHQMDIQYKTNEQATLQSQGTVYIDVDTQHQDGKTWNDDRKKIDEGHGVTHAQVRNESRKIVKTETQNIESSSPVDVNTQHLPSSESSWQVQKQSNTNGAKQGQWKQIQTSEKMGGHGQKITKYTYQTQLTSSHHQSFYHSSENPGAHQFRRDEKKPNFPALIQKDGKWEVRRVSVDDKIGYSPQTSTKALPLERKVTLGAKDKNAPQRKELMKEFKEKAQTKIFEDVLDDGTYVKRTIHINGGTTLDEPGTETRAQSVREHVVMSKRF